ncbi:redox-regulated ATPase YchF [Candidatus Kuenenbacteria bacterium]|uniref:Ribosome-binding ATPase YchF n=3 Tax=Candidatus Kueneniibacteriota TaxID=1752740 RepID=A0A2M7MHH1_9BACT|nr:redox-regulated ATPase YchF [Candidatus Kuenenbacteria bacterium]PIP29045.1 MAG: redox-regulated ATPase YchF [Candidatus Kuenenbacteria bacterium CG23_combo_of_CG06-09_8_20_14_all_39_39]PIX92477.1 MAG: redox-regulated ATPase YchF [Candidatus Kuenenbacteria bacterium CG_4_10_14_3_um_filter_39_14]
MKIGIVGLPNVGKSTLFKALTKKQVDTSNYPFCTIDPNVGVVAVPDERLQQLADLYHSEKIVPAAIEFVDIAGLVKNAHKGEGLGNQFLSHIREVDAIAHVIRNFQDENVTHVAGKIEPGEDLNTIETELAMADIATIEKVLIKIESKIKSNDKDAPGQKIILKNIIIALDKGKKPDIAELKDDEQKFIKGLSLLSLKPELFIENIGEEQLNNFKPVIPNSIPICAKLESELADLDGTEAKNYLKELNIKKTGLDQLIVESYKLLNLITFFTAGPKESHAWTIVSGTKAPAAAGKIHTDFEQGFIRAEIINWKNLLDAGGEIPAKEKGQMKIEGKDYIMRDSDVVYFRFSK